MIEGIFTAIITPLKNGTVDLDAFEQIIDRQIAAGVQGLVVLGTTGEGSLLTPDERRSVIKTSVARGRNRIQIIAGTGKIATWETVEETRIAADLGVDAALVVSPSYVRPSQEGIASHFEKVADEAGLPIVIYNVPSRTGSDILPSTVARLAKHEKIVGIKEATGSVLRVGQVIAAAAGRMSVLSGDDPITVSLLIAGGQGVICTGSNVAPDHWVALWKAWKEGNIPRAVAMQATLLRMHEALFLEANPGPVKAAAHQLGLIEPEIRLPLTWPTPKTLYRLAEELKHLGFNPQGVA
ncbi:MAG: 4-hydroxy-tetrahydrodipicolinate synthase [Proteobacteria bacterium]|nr:4-hydroxy-tetrahydrodipicolinate synthase [Pseudomonadota bacterium]